MYVSTSEFDGGIDRYVVTADELQADHYLRALTKDNREIQRRIGSCRTAMARYEATGDVDHAGRLRDRLCIERQEQGAIEQMIANLQRRFDTLDGAIVARRSS